MIHDPKAVELVARALCLAAGDQDRFWLGYSGKASILLDAIAPRYPQVTVNLLVWEPMNTAPRDGTWFAARTKAGTMRIVHFADQYDRLPVAHDNIIWSTVPVEWAGLPAVSAALTPTPVAASQTPDPVASALQQPEHFDDVAVRSFAKVMAEKMAVSRAKGRSGWDNPAQCSVEYLRESLYEHLAKGDPVDVANICMMLRHYEASTVPAPQPDPIGAEWMRREAYDSLFKHPGFIRVLGGQQFKAVKLEDAAEGILAIPLPTEADLLAHALAMPKIAALVEALVALLELNDTHSPFGGEMYRDRVERTWDKARASLAALDARDAEGGAE